MERGGKGGGKGTFSGGVKRPHVEDVDALHFSEDFETLETGGLILVCGHCAGGGAWGKEILDGADLWFFVKRGYCQRLIQSVVCLTGRQWVNREFCKRRIQGSCGDANLDSWERRAGIDNTALDVKKLTLHLPQTRAQKGSS